MKCPYCEFKFGLLAVNADKLPDFAPLVCEGCARISLLENGVLRKISDEEFEAIKKSPAWEFLEKARDKILEQLSEVAKNLVRLTLSDGSPVTPDHREIDPKTGQQKGYIVLSQSERAKGFIRPVRRTYTHKLCGRDTTMALAIAETYARDPKFYSGSFCVWCRQHYPLTEFVWMGTNEELGS